MKRLTAITSPRRISIAAAVALALAGGSARAATDTWVGNTSINWNDINWTGGNNPPITGDLFTFGAAGTAGAILNNDLAALFSVGGITFNAGASAYTFAGNQIVLTGNVTNNSTSLETINLNMQLDAQRVFTTVTGGGNFTLGGLLSGAGSYAAAGVGRISVTGTANTFTGEILFGNAAANVASTVVNVASLSDYGVASSIGARTQAAENNTANGIGLHFKGGTLQYTGSTPQSTNREIRILNGSVGATIDASGTNPAATLSFTHTGANINLFDTGGTRTMVLTGTNTGNNSFSIRLINEGVNQTSLRKSGAGTWLIANSDNTNTGEIFIQGGILDVASVSDYGVASSIGSRAFADENISGTGVGLHFQGGTLRYSGSTPQSTNRNIRVLNGNGATIDASGSNPAATLSFTHTGANMNLFDTGGTRTITLTGTNTGNNGFSILIADQSILATSLSKTGTGTWVLNGPDTNAATGTTSVTGGILSLGKVAAIAVNGPLVIGNGSASAAVQLASTGTGGNQIVDTVIPSFGGTGANAGILRMNNLNETVGGLTSTGGAGVVENESGAAGIGSLTVNVAGTQTFSGSLRDGDGVGTDGQLAFTKLGAGTQTLAGTSTHTGVTTVSAGTLAVSGSIAASTINVTNSTLTVTGSVGGAVNVQGGAIFNGTGTVGGAVSLASNSTLTGTLIVSGSVTAAGGSHISPGTATTPGTISIGTLTLNTGSLLDYELGATPVTSDLVSVSGPLTLNGGGFNLFNPGGTTPLSVNGVYTLLDYTTPYTGSLSNLTIANAQTGKFYSIADDTVGTLIKLTVGDATIFEWSGGAGDGQWPTAGNWIGGVPNAAGTVAKFGTIPGSPTAVAVNGAKVVGSILFDNANAFTVTGGAGDAITLNNGVAAAGLTVNNGSHVIAAPITLATDAVATTTTGTSLLLISGNITGARGFTAAGSGTTTLTGSNSYTTTTVTGGMLQIGNGGTSGTIGTGDVNISTGGVLVFNRSDSFSIANNITGTTGQVTKLGAGVLTLSGTNTFATATGGSLNLNAGTVKVGGASALGSGIVLNFGGGALDLNGNDVTASSLAGATGSIGNSSAVAGTNTLTVNQIVATTFGGTIADGATRTTAVNKIGSGTLTLTGNNTFTGPLTIRNGAVIAAGSGTVPITTNVTMGDGSNDIFLISGGASNQYGPNTVLTYNNAGKNAKFLLRGNNQTIAGIDSLTDPSVSLAIIQNDDAIAPGYTVAPPSATLTINTTTNHVFAGLIRTLNGGLLHLVKEGPAIQEIRNVLVAPLDFGNATVNAGTLLINLSPNANNNNILGVNTSLIVNAGGTLGLDGNWTNTRPISGAGNVLKQGTGTVILTGANNYTGTTTISGGVLQASTAGTSIPGNIIFGTGAQTGIFLATTVANQFGPNTVITFNNGPGRDAKFELRGTAQTVAGISSDADDTLSIIQNQEGGAPAATTLTINNSADFVFNGLIRTQAGGLLGMLKTGTGTQELRNVPAQGYNFGPLTINQGKLVFNLTTLAGGAVGHDTLGVNISIATNAGGTLGLDGTWTMPRPVSGTGDVLKQGTGTVNISGAFTNTGNDTISGGALLVTGSLTGLAKLDILNGGTLGGTGTIAPASAATGDVNMLAGGKLSPGVAAVGTLTTTFSGGGEFNISTGVASVNSQSLVFELGAPGTNDKVVLTGGALNIGTGVLAINDFAFAPLAGFGIGTYTLFDGNTPIAGTFDTANVLGPVGAFFGTIEFSDGGNDLILTVIPEPGTALSLLAGLGLLAGLRRRR